MPCICVPSMKEREREADRQRDRQTDRQTETEGQRQRQSADGRGTKGLVVSYSMNIEVSTHRYLDVSIGLQINIDSRIQRCIYRCQGCTLVRNDHSTNIDVLVYPRSSKSIGDENSRTIFCATGDPLAGSISLLILLREGPPTDALTGAACGREERSLPSSDEKVRVCVNSQ